MENDKTKKQQIEEYFKLGVENFKKKYELQAVKFYYLRIDSIPVVTVAIAKRGDTYYRAFSICSIHENEVLKKRGRTESFNRLRKVVSTGMDDIHHLSDDPAAIAMTMGLPNFDVDGYGINFRLGQVNVEPTEQEKKMLA